MKDHAYWNTFYDEHIEGSYSKTSFRDAHKDAFLEVIDILESRLGQERELKKPIRCIATDRYVLIMWDCHPFELTIKIDPEFPYGVSFHAENEDGTGGENRLFSTRQGFADNLHELCVYLEPFTKRSATKDNAVIIVIKRDQVDVGYILGAVVRCINKHRKNPFMPQDIDTQTITAKEPVDGKRAMDYAGAVAKRVQHLATSLCERSEIFIFIDVKEPIYGFLLKEINPLVTEWLFRYDTHIMAIEGGAGEINA